MGGDVGVGDEDTLCADVVKVVVNLLHFWFVEDNTTSLETNCCVTGT
jgi:hypothetical protein